MSETTDNTSTSRTRLLAVLEEQIEERKKLQKSFKVLPWIPTIFAITALVNMVGGILQYVESSTNDLLIVMAFAMLIPVAGLAPWNNGLNIKNLEAWRDYLADPTTRDLGASDQPPGSPDNPLKESTSGPQQI